MKAGLVAVLALLATAVTADVNADLWQNYAESMRNSMGFGDAIKGNPNFAVAIAGKSSMLLLGNELDCVNNQAASTIADSASSTNNPIFVPGSGGFFSAYKLFLNSIKPKTTNNPGLIPQLAKDKQNYLKLSDQFSKTQGEVFTKYSEYVTAISAVRGARPLDMISWRAKYYPKYRMMEDSVSAAKSKIDTAEALLWGPAYSTIQDAKKKLEMAESLETSTGFNMPVCPLRATKMLQDYENPDNWANTDTNASPPEDPKPQEISFKPMFTIMGAQNFIDEMRNKGLHEEEGQNSAELTVSITKAKARADASAFGFSAWGGVFTPFFFVGGWAGGNQQTASSSFKFEDIQISFGGHRLLTIDPPPWYDASLVATFWNSLYPGLDKVLFGPQGQFNFIPRQVMLAYNPGFKIGIKQGDWNAYQRSFAAVGHGVIPFTIGPFAVSASFAAGGSQAGTNAKYDNGYLEVNTKSDSLYLVGVVGEKVIAAGKNFLGMMGDDQDDLNFAEEHLNFDEEEDDEGSKNFWKFGSTKQQPAPTKKTGSVAVPTGSSDEPLSFDLKNVQVEKGEVKFAFSPQGFNVDKTDDAVFSAQLNLRRDRSRRIA